MLTFAITRMYEKRRTGICEGVNTSRQWAVFVAYQRDEGSPAGGKQNACM